MSDASTPNTPFPTRVKKINWENLFLFRPTKYQRTAEVILVLRSVAFRGLIGHSADAWPRTLVRILHTENRDTQSVMFAP